MNFSFSNIQKKNLGFSSRSEGWKWHIILISFLLFTILKCFSLLILRIRDWRISKLAWRRENTGKPGRQPDASGLFSTGEHQFAPAVSDKKWLSSHLYIYIYIYIYIYCSSLISIYLSIYLCFILLPFCKVSSIFNSQLIQRKSSKHCYKG